MAGTFLKWLIPGVVTVVGGTALALAQTASPIATDLGARASSTIATADFGWSKVRIDGRDAIVTGTATTQKMIDDVVAKVAEVHGVRAVTSDVVLAEFVSPFPFSATLDKGVTTLAGGYPTESVHAAILKGVAGTTDTTRLLSGAPDSATFEAGASFGLSALTLLDQGEVKLADLSLTITGRAKSTEALGDLQALRNTVPAGVTLASLTITPPLATPYVWTATFDGATVAIVGDVPTAELEEQLRAVAPANIAVSTGLNLASGEPAGFSANALELLKTLLTLEQGEARIVDGVITLDGAPQSSAIADMATASLTKLGGTATLEPPRIAEYTTTVAKTGDSLVFTGFVPDAASRDKLAALKGADVSKLTLGRGAPERFASALDFGLEALGHLQDGRFEIKGSRLTIGGRAGSVAEFKAASAMVAEGAPQGLTLATAELRPPVAKPFRFSATKSDNGETSFTGYLPDDTIRAALMEQVAKLSADNTDPADGAPDNFAFLAGKGLEVLALLDSGSLNYDGTNWTIDGVVDSPRKGFAADAAYSSAGLRTLGWTYKVRLPSLPIISPYVWRAQKTTDGGVSVTGFSPTDEFKAAIKTSAPKSLDATVLGAGAPADFEASAAAGLEALLALDEGSLGLSGTRWSLTGEVADAKMRDTIQTTLSGKINSANWLITIQARDSAPAVTPYLWSATKSPDGTTDLGGYLPSDALKEIVTVRAGAVGRDTTVIASGEPSGFSDDVFAGLDALSHLTEGKAYFDGSKWVLTGSAAAQSDGEAAVAALLQGSRAGASWTTAVSGYLPPAAESAEPSSSQEASSSEEPSSSDLAPSASSEQPSAEPSSSEPSSSEQASSSEPVSSEVASSEPSSAEEPAPSSEAMSSSEEPVVERGLEVVDPLPPTFVFEASRELGAPVVLKGGIPDAATADLLGVLTGGAATDGLLPQTGLPADFASSASMGLNALLRLSEGRLGFDGTKWWLRGKSETQDLADALKANIATLPNGADWSVFIDLLPPIDMCRDRVNALAKRNAIVFESGSATLTKGSLPVIDELAIDLNICADSSVHVEGHTDADGAEDLNLALSVARAESVVEALIERGIAVERLYAEGYGESEPIASNDTKEGKAQNRRIVFSISKE